MGRPWALGGGQSWLINRGLHSALCSFCPQSSLFSPRCWLQAQTPAPLQAMAALHMLWMGLVLLGLLGFPQTPAESKSYDSVQPNFQEDRVRLPYPTPKTAEPSGQ